jgi:alcohol dehydrogenase YqhD (iron-dependent ADH family)
MNNFEFYNPVHVIFGAGEINRLGQETKKIGTKALLVSYKNHSFFSEQLIKAEKLLQGSDVDVVTYFGISENPKMSEVVKGVAVCKEKGVDVLIGFGGGSVMDATKLIAAGVLYEGDLWNMVYSRHDDTANIQPPQNALPVVMIPTVPATGSEMNPTAVVTNDETMEKSYTWSVCMYPRISIVDPELTCSLPPFVTACSAADTIAHVLEFHITGFEDAPLNNRIQEGVMLTVLEQVGNVLQNPNDVTSRAHLQWASIIALNGISQPGDGWTPMHQLAHVLSAQYDLPHGASLTIIMPAWMRYFYKSRLDRYVQFAQRVFQVDDDFGSQEEIALEGIRRFEEFLISIGVPTKLGDVKINEADIPKLADEVVKISFGQDGFLRSRPPANKDDVINVYKLAI